MESINEKMDAQLRTRVDELTRANDENQDGRLDAADLKAQLNRIEAQLELQDQQNRGIIANQRGDSGGVGVLWLAHQCGLQQCHGCL